jgi:hypothetical protein
MRYACPFGGSVFHCLIWASQQSLPSQPEATPVDGKGKGKAKDQPLPEPTLFETLFRETVGGGDDQELRDIEYAIKLSLQDRDATDIKKAHASKASRVQSRFILFESEIMSFLFRQ